MSDQLEEIRRVPAELRETGCDLLADDVAWLVAEVERLREALGAIAECFFTSDTSPPRWVRIARTALSRGAPPREGTPNE